MPTWRWWRPGRPTAGAVLTYRSSVRRNFNPVMAMGCIEVTIVQTQHLVELGELDPEKGGDARHP